MADAMGIEPKDDIVFVDSPVEAHGVSSERSPTQRAIVGMAGKYTLDSWRNAKGEARVFCCSILKMSARAIELSVPVTGPIGDRICVYFEKLGKFEGPVVRTGRRSLVMKIVATADEVGKIADKIAWIEDSTTPDSRRHERLVPFDPGSSVVLSDGSIIPCQIIDYSISGAAVSADHDPAVGTVVKVGDIIGNVVRQFDGGFAVEFTVIQQDRVVEELVKKTSK